MTRKSETEIPAMEYIATLFGMTNRSLILANRVSQIPNQKS